MEKTYDAKSNDDVMTLFGSFDENVNLIERETGVRIVPQDTTLRIIGDNAEKAHEVIRRLMADIESGNPVTEQSIRYAIFAVDENIDFVPPAQGDYICITAKGKSVKCKTYGQ